MLHYDKTTHRTPFMSFICELEIALKVSNDAESYYSILSDDYRKKDPYMIRKDTRNEILREVLGLAMRHYAREDSLLKIENKETINLPYIE